MDTLSSIANVITVIIAVIHLVNYVKEKSSLEKVKNFIDKIIDQVLIVSVSVQCIGYCLLAVIYGIMAYEKYDINVAILIASILILPSFYFFYRTIMLTKANN